MKIIPVSIFVAVALALGAALPVTAATVDGPLSIEQLSSCRVRVSYADNPDQVLAGALSITVDGVTQPEGVSAGGLDTGPGTDDSVSFTLDVEDGELVAASISGEDGYDVSLTADCGGSIVIELDVEGNAGSRNFDFGFNPGADFSIKDNQTVTRDDLEDDDYSVDLEENGWEITDVNCTGDESSDVRWDEDGADIELNDGEDIECVIEVEEADDATVTPTATPTATPVPTSTPVPPLVIPTFAPVPVAPTPIVIIREVPVPVQRISPPSTGDGGLVQ